MVQPNFLKDRQVPGNATDFFPDFLMDVRFNSVSPLFFYPSSHL
jgi:hypothetical protein